jgi:hypothetical protein
MGRRSSSACARVADMYRGIACDLSALSDWVLYSQRFGLAYSFPRAYPKDNSSDHSSRVRFAAWHSGRAISIGSEACYRSMPGPRRSANCTGA